MENYVKIIIAIVIIIILLILLFLGMKKGGKISVAVANRTFKNYLKDIQQKMKDVNVLTTIELPTTQGRCIPSTGDTAYADYNTAQGELFRVYELAQTFRNMNESIIKPELLTEFDALTVEFNKLSQFLFNLPSCEQFCTMKGTATWDKTKCTCNQGYKDPTTIMENNKSYVLCADTQASTDMRQKINEINPQFQNVISKVPSPTLENSPGCVTWLAANPGKIC